MASSSNSSFTPCPDPFIAELSIGDAGGYLAGRWCTPQTIGDETVSCCFPCPFTEWQYTDGFNPTNMVSWIAVGVLILMVISALTFILLPVSDTQRHYLTSSPLMGFVFMSIAFIIPLGPSDKYCHDAITPNYWLSETTCACPGFFRSLSLYLQLIWNIESGPKFRVISLLCIFGGSLALLGIALGVSGVSYQVGEMCYISYPKSAGSFWAPLIAVAFVSFLIQIFIMRSRLSLFKRPERERPSTDDSSPRVTPPRRTGKKIWRILQLQWRAIAIACLVLLYVVYFAQAILRYGDPGQYSPEEMQPLVDCLVRTKGDKRACHEEASHIGPNQATAVSALALLASCGIWGVICTARYTMLLGWLDIFNDITDYIYDTLHGRRSRERPRPPDLERIVPDLPPKATTAIHTPTPTTPKTLEDVDRLYGTRKYHVPQNSFSRPGRARTVSVAGSAKGSVSTFAPSSVSFTPSTAPASTITTTIEGNAHVEEFDLKEMKPS
ncbi:uncharacterized protein BDV17DRAFT_298745 [Aspergillus undulatus]|uniref:uncharacterized protein n=1 Tax=Aspergillus undulatus TaxID=1810928 RepID=UPI003CCE385B